MLETGEQGYETDTGRLKVGDGTTAWTSLAYIDADLVANDHLVGLTATQTLTNKTMDSTNTIGDAAVGTVSESAGTPTGAVIERSSNANGEYVKFADGTVIFHRDTIIDLQSSSVIVNIPITLSTLDDVSLFLSAKDNATPGGDDHTTLYQTVCRLSSTTQVQIRPRTSGTPSTTFTVVLGGIGRWY